MKTALSIAGSDSGGGAGIQADIKAFARCGVHGTTAIVAITAQNTVGVSSIFALPTQVVIEQIEAVVSDIGADAVKTGMLFNAEIVSAVAGAIRRLGLKNVVVDPVMVAESGATLLEPEAVDAYREELLPLADVITPNLDEAFVLAGRKKDPEKVHGCARDLAELGPGAVIITGGHRASGEDLLYDGEHFVEIEGPVHESGATHGSGCTHSSALAAFLAHGFGLEEAARRARAIASEAVEYGLTGIGRGAGPVNVLGPLMEGEG
ncbi:bifunctional hydroxymethylpyrimidine kinase/phosphomethylpyrimidine kinase [Rubrobacter calidifluminis]|uniref:bifunctional hydroxymethylpyrimidine kinase/phosphomethylpyrimidine kinase n=1 Tax=Rubrobacter calidifluminis TaxID=1392640 RepID=UPI00235E344D|nr:bifunctional hydroxymethylpyrimidine kinase/phosphomethylpyrimidine kinase [Rubrobacter calidifluminis]